MVWAAATTSRVSISFLLPLLRGQLECQNTISDTELHQRLDTTRRWTVNFHNKKLQASQLHATPIRRKNQCVWETASELCCFHVFAVLLALDCYGDMDGVQIILLLLLRGNLKFQNSSSDTERYQRIEYIRRYTVNFINSKLQASLRHAAPIHRRDKRLW